MQKTLAEIAALVNGEVIGNKKLIIKGFNSLEDAQEGEMSFLVSPKYLSVAQKTKASVIVTSRGLNVPGKILIVVDNPSLSFAKILSEVSGDQTYTVKGVHKSAIIADDAKIGSNVSIGPFVVIESKAAIGNNSIIQAGSYIGQKTAIGCDCHIYPNVVVREKNQVGDRVIIHSGTVIGSDGFGFEQVGGVSQKIPQIGIVVIGNDVEIGANVTVDRARFTKTVIGSGTKIDNLVQIAHNVEIGENCVIVSQVGISGSTKIGRNSILAGQAGLAGHLTIGEGTVIAAQSGVTKSLPAFSKVSGYPAHPHDEAKTINAHVQRLPHYVEIIQDLKKRIETLEKKNKKK